MRAGLGLLVAASLLAACTSTPERATTRDVPTDDPTVVAGLALPEHAAPDDPRQVLSLVPADAEVVTITDFDAVRSRLGAEELTGESLMTDRSAFWAEAEREAVLLTDGLLRAGSSRFELDHGFTQDDVDWEAHFTGPDGAGWVLAFRPDLDLSRVRGALKEKELRGARLMPAQHLLVHGTAAEGDPVWAMEGLWTSLTEEGAESTYLRRGCVPVREALGPDATYDDQVALVEQQDPTYLRPLEEVAVSFRDAIATARLAPEHEGERRLDVHARADIVEVWPATGSPGVGDAFGGLPVADPTTGRVGLQVASPVAAAAVTLTGQLPFAVCNEVLPFEEPTGL